MSEISQLVRTLKKRLKIQGVTYKELAVTLGITEPSVKRMFASERFTLERVVEISHFLGFTLAELASESAIAESHLHALSEMQERELVSDEKLLLVAVCVLNQWAVTDIVGAFALTEAECIQRLVHLDRLRLITLLPENRIRLNIARDFDWRVRGPIHRYFLGQGLGDFLQSEFSQDGEVMAFSHAMLTETALNKLLSEIKKLRQKLAELHEESLAYPLPKRHGIGMLLAMREWEITAFRNLRRTN